MTKPLADQVALVTGATTGIGRAVALALAEAGAHVCLNHFQREAETQIVATEIQALGREALLYDADVSDLNAVERMVQAVVARFGRINIAVANAYFSEREYFYKADMKNFRRTVDVTMWGVFNLFRATSQRMIAQKQGGSLVAISSPHAYLPFERAMAYNMSKAAVDQLTKTAALELSEFRIRVNTVYPGWTDTPGERKFYTDDQLAQAGHKLPFGRLGRPEEVARGVVFLCDPASEYMTGSSLLIDGGVCLPFWARGGKLD